MLRYYDALRFGQRRIYCSFKNLHAIVLAVAHGDDTVCVNSDATGGIQLALTLTMGTDGSNMGAICIPQHPHTVPGLIGYKDVACTVEGDA